MNIYEKLLAVQTELKAPKGQFNSFGNYKYRSCEDILEALKPILAKHKATVIITDDIELIGERYYIKATVTFADAEKGDVIKTTALAREEQSKKGMDGSQVTGASSSYARKYALNGMFAIDDTKDSDSTNTHGKDETEQKKPQTEQKVNEPTAEQLAELRSLGGTIQKIATYYKVEIENVTAEMVQKMIDKKKSVIAKEQKNANSQQ